MRFFILSGTDVDFSDQKLRWKTYNIKKALSTIRRVKPIGRKEFLAVAFNPKHETFIVYIASLSFTPLNA